MHTNHQEWPGKKRLSFFRRFSWWSFFTSSGSLIMIASLLALVLVSCQDQAASSSPAEFLDFKETPFLPPTLTAPTPTLEIAAGQASTEQPAIQPTPACVNNLTFEEDITIPDRTVAAPGELLDKRWQVKNSGTCNWDRRYRLKRISGQVMGAPEELALYPARSGTQALIRMIFTAPQEPGSYNSAWQAFNPQGDPFGDPFFIDIVVAQPAQSP